MFLLSILFASGVAADIQCLEFAWPWFWSAPSNCSDGMEMPSNKDGDAAQTILQPETTSRTIHATHNVWLFHSNLSRQKRMTQFTGRRHLQS